jgi:hypothetical protein
VFLRRKSLSHAIWYPALARAHVPAARGVHFASLGHSVARAAPLTQSSNADCADAQSRSKPGEHKRLELLPEETLYLVERGSLACAFAYDDMDPALEAARPAMSVQQAFAAMIGTEGLTLERYQVRALILRMLDKFSSSSSPAGLLLLETPRLRCHPCCSAVHCIPHAPGPRREGARLGACRRKHNRTITAGKPNTGPSSRGVVRPPAHRALPA